MSPESSSAIFGERGIDFHLKYLVVYFPGSNLVIVVFKFLIYFPPKNTR